MGWKGALRSARASARASRRNAQRRQREFEREQKRLAKARAIEAAAHEARRHQGHLEALVSLHHDCSESIPWREIATAGPPPAPLVDQEGKAQKELETYAPSFWDRLFRQEEKKRARLQGRLLDAKERDRQTLLEHQQATEEWQARHTLASGILEKRLPSMQEALSQHFRGLPLRPLTRRVTTTLGTHGIPEIHAEVTDDEVIPEVRKSLTQSGRLSERKIPRGQANEIYQDSICSLVLRLARETFAVLPVDGVIVTVRTHLLDLQTGHLELCPILSAALPRRTVEFLRVQRLDPSEAMRNFVHVMSFKKTTGFSEVQPLDPGTVDWT